MRKRTGRQRAWSLPNWRRSGFQARLSPGVSAPSEAWRFLWGGSPHRIRSRQPPVPSVACVEKEQKPRTKHRKRTQGTLEVGRVTAHPKVWYSLVKALTQTATVFTHRKPIPCRHDGEMSEGLSGSSGPGMQREKRCEHGRPHGFLTTGRPPRSH